MRTRGADLSLDVTPRPIQTFSMWASDILPDRTGASHPCLKPFAKAAMGRAEDLFARLESEGVDAINDLFEQKKSEEAFLDFKRSADQGAGVRLHDDDRKNLSRALSGFANTDGGVIVWGVGTGGTRGSDAASERHPIADCGRFAGWIENAVSGCTVPAITGVRSISIKEKELDGAGYVVTLIPSSLSGPHQLQGEGVYLMRTGSSFKPVPHVLLAGMFGRRPQPRLKIVLRPGLPEMLWLNMDDPLSKKKRRHRLAVELGVFLSNDSAIPAQDGYVSWKVCGPLQEYAVHPSADSDLWLVHRTDDWSGGCLADPGNKLVPFSEQLAPTLHLLLEPPFSSPLEIDLVAGCAGAPPERASVRVSPETLQTIFARYKQLHGRGKGMDKDEQLMRSHQLFGLSHGDRN